VDNVLRYSNRDDLVEPLSVILERIAIGDSEDVGTVPDDYEPRRPIAQTHQLTELQRQAIFTAYRQGVGPRAIAEHYGVTERAIKYLVKKHGIQRGPRLG
jgi:hypothetical protein